MLDAFQRLKITAYTLGGTLISWDLRRTFLETGPYEFTVQVAHHANADDWVDVNEIPLIDTLGAVITDVTQRRWAVYPTTFYRVRLVTGQGTHYSMAQQVLGNPTRRDWLLIRKISRNENIGFTKYGGTLGSLYKRRTFGQPCPGYEASNGKHINCLDHDLKVSSNSECPVCFGIGITCGYYEAIDAAMRIEGTNIDRRTESGRGTVEDQIRTAIALAWPIPEYGDVWRRKDTDERFIVNDVALSNEFRGLPVLYTVHLRPAPATSPVHKLPITGSPCADDYYTPGYGYYGEGGYGFL